MIEFMKEVKKIDGVTDDEAAQIAASKIANSKPKSLMYHKIEASRKMAGCKKVDPMSNLSDKLKDVYGSIVDGKEIPVNREKAKKSTIEFITSSTAVMENIGKFNVIVRRFGNTANEAKIRIDTIEGSACEGKDFKGIHDIYTFKQNQADIEFEIELIDDDDWEPDEEFFLRVSLPKDIDNDNIKIGRKNIMTVVILNDDEPGTFSFDKQAFFVKESCGTENFTVYRENGADGDIEVRWRTLNRTAVRGKDFNGDHGILYFRSGEMNKAINIEIINNMSTRGKGTDEYFEIELYETNCKGAKLGKFFRITVTIVDDDELQNLVENMMDLTNVNLNDMKLYSKDWSKQLKNAMCVNGGDLEKATSTDYIMHYITFGLKVIFASCPPPGKAGGWPAFLVSLFYIGFLVLLITDLALIFGCLIGLKDEVTAFTIVTFGISQIDLFASRIAAVNDPAADNSIGNVVAANAIGVFIGLGFPWLIASVYWEIVDPQVGFLVPASGLSFQVLVYSICAVIALTVLIIRRNFAVFGKAELGGDACTKYLSSALLLILWIIYFILASLHTYDVI